MDSGPSPTHKQNGWKYAHAYAFTELHPFVLNNSVL